jgi:hypothetical protein
MAKFRFFFDQKVTIWRRDYCDMEAETEEEAILKMKSRSVTEDLLDCVESDESELLYETEMEMTYEENGNQPTIEIVYDAKVIENNTPLDVRRDKKINTIIDEKN